jgi:hypothetical protein
MNLSSSIALVAAVFGSTAFARESSGLTLQEALNLPAPVLSDRVLGAAGELYPELQRPYLGGVPGGQGFTLEFATAPRSAGFPGLCEADTISVYFGSAEASSNNPTAHVRSLVTGKVYRIVGDTTPINGGWNDEYGRTLAARCTASGPVLSAGGAELRRFFDGRYNSSNDFWAAHAYFGARALSKARGAAAAHTLSVTACREDTSHPEDHICADPLTLLRNLPMELFLGFEIAGCARDHSKLCVEANFARDRDSDGRVIAITIRTNLSEIIGPPPEFEVRDVQIEASTAVN